MIRFLSIDQKPSWFNNAGHAGGYVRTYTKKGSSDNCLWMHWWMPGMDGRDRPPASDSQSDWL